MRVQTKTVIAVAVVAVAVGAALLFLKGRGRDAQETKVEETRAGKGKKPYLVQKSAAVSAVKYPAASKRGPGKEKVDGGRMPLGRIGGGRDVVYSDSEGNPYPPEDQKIMAAAEAAIEQDDLEGARSLAEKALKSNNAELKEMVVDALGWFGEAAMAELTPFMSDANEDVAQAATDHWKSALQEMSDDGEKAGVVEMSLKSLKNKDMLEDVANELIGMDEVAALQVLANVIEGENKAAVEAARDTYESITGEEWSGVDAAEQWLQENYTPPDDDDE